MKIEDAINELVSYIKKVYEQINNKVGQNIYRGHLRSISTDIEDGIALFLSKILPEGYKLFLDSSIHVDGVNFRPDVLVVNDKNECYAMIEIKANMGWYRDATNVINDIVSNHNKFSKETILNCKFSRETTQSITYGLNTKLYLIALTDGNCNAEKHENNKAYASSVGIKQFNLFSGWYGELISCEIDEFAKDLLA